MKIRVSITDDKNRFFQFETEIRKNQFNKTAFENLTLKSDEPILTNEDLYNYFLNVGLSDKHGDAAVIQEIDSSRKNLTDKISESIRLFIKKVLSFDDTLNGVSINSIKKL